MSVARMRRHAHCVRVAEPRDDGRRRFVNAAEPDGVNSFIFLSPLFRPKSDSRRSHFWPILFCTGRRSDAASAARRARRLPDDAATKVARQPRAFERKAFLFPATQRSESRRER
ncbi:hypothetical protein Bamb_0014 [Burkholderia ambifaria AMMD]|uniref:Uncharacterized protein n=1 Tax=Burkholderia ambifaria (strain ATCC BAA-244 / DSM 16087 / CCUG 44356 / LMG 19182 / AMMD) TaxID=339670 RepID=Q0BJU8_BURCM|nr:hypothetical protein Bamb_0014 [Burkholderia ambifaria AMMD]